MAKKKRKKDDKTFSASTYSPLVEKFQRLIQEQSDKFRWAQLLDPKEVRFVYDMLANAEAKKGFIPTQAQGAWLASIYKKNHGSRKSE